MFKNCLSIGAVCICIGVAPLLLRGTRSRQRIRGLDASAPNSTAVTERGVMAHKYSVSPFFAIVNKAEVRTRSA